MQRLTIIIVYHFNSHAHVERDPKSACPYQQHFHFNSHAHVERDLGYYFGTEYKLISTHTLTWSVTECFELKCSLMLFQLTRSRGA